MSSPTEWTWVWVDSGNWWWTGRPGVLQFMGSQRVRHDWANELTELTELSETENNKLQRICFVKFYSVKKRKSLSFWNKGLTWWKCDVPKVRWYWKYVLLQSDLLLAGGRFTEKEKVDHSLYPWRVGSMCSLGYATESWPQYLPSLAWQGLFLAENQSVNLIRLGCKIFNLNLLPRRVLS